MIKVDEVVTIAGVDYGAKNVGTSCICYNKGTKIYNVTEKKKSSFIKVVTGTIENHLPFPLNRLPENWHQFDALLCWIICFRYIHDKAKAVGDENEGVIYI
jgi:hypothetical protein